MLIIPGPTHLQNLAEPLHLVMTFEGARARFVGGHPTAEEALAAARGR